MLGQVIADYELTDYIGAGATGVVFRGRRTATAPNPVEKTGLAALEFPEEAAIKLLSPPLGATDAELALFQQRFVREARTLKQFDHPHILRLIDYGQDATTGYFYMVLHYMAGGSLANVLARRGPLPLAEVASILAQIGDALDYAHREGVIHRDVKPGNILLDAEGVPYLSDFSIVRLLSETATLRTSTGRMMGTPAYMAPEQFGDSSRVGPAADLYGLGMVAYELVTGHAAFGATNWAQVMLQQIQEAPANPSVARPDLPKPAEAAIMRALVKDPEERFTSGAAFADAFAQGLDGRWADGLTQFVSTGAPRASRTTGASSAQTIPERAPEAPSRSRGRVGVLGAAVALLLVCACVAAAMFGFPGSPLSAMLVHFTAHTPTSGVLANVAINTPKPGQTSVATHPAATKTKANNNGTSGGPAATSIPGGPTSTPIPGAPPTATPIPATATPSLPTLVISTDPSKSTDGQSHGSGNPYYFTGNHSWYNVTIQTGAWATAISTCGAGGTGTVQFTAIGTVTIAGTLEVNGQGYCGGAAIMGAAGGMQGNSYAGASSRSNAPNYGGGGGGDGADSGGGGGGYGSSGGNALGSSNTFGGNAYGDPTLYTLYLGSGGGSSGAQSGAIGGAGGNGGGAVSIRAASIVVTGVISANGANGTSRQSSDPTNYRGGGGGSGGSIYLHANSISLPGTVTAVGGQGGYGVGGMGNISGGNGADGRIRIEYSQSFSGSTTPAASIG